MREFSDDEMKMTQMLDNPSALTGPVTVDTVVAVASDDYRRADMRRSVNLRRGTVVVALFLVAVIVVSAILVRSSGRSSSANPTMVYFTVVRRDLPIQITERGSLESQKSVDVFCEVDDVPGDSIYGTPILWLIENGSKVKKGDLVVELDSASHIERVDNQILGTTYARGQFTARTIDYANRKLRNQTIMANAELAVQIAQLQLDQFQDEEGGTYQLELQEIELGIQQKTARQSIEDRNRQGVERLFNLGYKSKGDLAQAELQALRADGDVRRFTSRRHELVDVDYLRTKLQLEGAVQSAKRALIQVERNNEATLAQQKVWLKMAELGKVWNESRLTRYTEQLGKCKIYAPQDGMVAYHMDSDGRGKVSTISVGAAVRYLQPLLSIPDLTRMRVKTSVHETVVNRVRAGMSATVRVDAFPDRLYDATVESVDVLPDPGGWLSSDTKYYKTVVTIDKEVDGIKPGMTAVVEVHVDQLNDVVCVPVQSIVQRGDETWCYVSGNGDPTRRPVEVGRTNEKFAEICSGLSSGERVVVNPLDVLESRTGDGLEISPDRERLAEF